MPQPHEGAEQPEPESRIESQVQLIRSAFGENLVGLGPKDATPATARYLFRADQILVRDEFLHRVWSVLTEQPEVDQVGRSKQQPPPDGPSADSSAQQPPQDGPSADSWAQQPPPPPAAPPADSSAQQPPDVPAEVVLPGVSLLHLTGISALDALALIKQDVGPNVASVNHIFSIAQGSGGGTGAGGYCPAT